MLKVETFVVGPIETNCYVAYDSDKKEGILIDPGIFDGRVEAFIKDNEIKIKYTVNTHGHYDHMGGNKEFGYPVLIHEKEKGYLSNPIINLSIMTGHLALSSKASRLLKEGDTIRAGDLEFKVIDTPGHTPGGMALICENVMFSGDTLFCEGVGRTDIPMASSRELMSSLDKLMRYKDETIVYPGHGPSTTIGHERNNNPFL